MKRSLCCLILFLTLFNSALGQISGIVLLDSLSLPGVEVKLKKSKLATTTNFDGEFILKNKFKTDDLIISYNGLSLMIIDLDMSNNLELGSVEMPYFKMIDIEEYERLSGARKKDCLPIRHWVQIIGYFDTSRLDQEGLILNCDKGIFKYNFDSKNRIISLNWKDIRNCLN